MDELKLLEPTTEYLEQIVSYKQEFLENGDCMDGTSNLGLFDNMEDWFQFIHTISNRAFCSSDLITGMQYICVRVKDNKVVGMLCIRDKLDEFSARYIGNIGYSIRKSEREKGYATQQLKLALGLCRKRGMDRVLITCNKENIASVKTILANGGVLENEIIDSDTHMVVQRFWVSVC